MKQEKFEYSAQEVAELIGWPTEKWPGNCYAVAHAMLNAGFVRGKLAYGHYHGFISDSSIFAGRRFTRHGWIIRRTTIVDPSRWAFEAKDPYVHVGPRDDPDYDVGGNRLRQMMLSEPPRFDADNCWTAPEELLPLLGAFGFGEVISAPQVAWLASLPLELLGDDAKLVFEWVAYDLKTPAFIPIDNRRLILGD